MAGARNPAAPIRGRFIARAGDFGFRIPPVPIRVKLLRARAIWTLYVQPEQPIEAPRIVEWLAAPSLLRLEFGSRQIVRADYATLPDAWQRAFHGVNLDLARLTPDGSAAVTVTGPQAAVSAFASELYREKAPLGLLTLQPSEPGKSLLTAAQDSALRAAVSSGYYRIPRLLNLDKLSKKLGISSASLSERLRRAEGRVITRYVDAGGASPWDEQTLYETDSADAISPEWPHVEDGDAR